ncbi:MAG: SPOR domain-containing protein [Bacteroidales bacterium]|nr:SPOR domain-containing protein [Bacteroidales bacterium]
MKLDQYIKELLIEKDSLIIKDFGAFEKVLQSAEIDEDSGEIKPPHVTLKFDPSLKIDSGTLSKYIALKEGFSEEEAVKKIAEQVKIWENELKEGKSIHLAGIGFIKLDNKGTKIFNAKISQGTFPDMYGLPVITVEKNKEKVDLRKQPIRKEPPKKKESIKEKKTEEKKITEKKAPVKKKPIKKEAPKKMTKEESEKAFKKLILTLLIVIPIIVIGVLVALNFDLVKEKFNSGSEYVSGLLSGEEQKEDNNIATDEINNSDTNKIAEIDNLDSTITEENETQKILENYTVINGQTNQTVSSEEQISETANIEIIAGSFSRLQNAKRYRNQLKNKGFSAKVLPKANGLYRVSIGSFNDLKAAGSEIENLHEIDPTLNVWILLNK